jgi:hypothetical protein
MRPGVKHKRVGKAKMQRNAAARLRTLARQVTTQEMLNRWLLQEPDPLRRQALFAYVKPMLPQPLRTFATFPTQVITTNAPETRL